MFTILNARSNKYFSFIFLGFAFWTNSVLAVGKVPNPEIDCSGFNEGKKEVHRLQKVSKEPEEQLKKKSPSDLVNIDSIYISPKVLENREKLQLLAKAPNSPMYQYLFQKTAYYYLSKMIKQAEVATNGSVKIFVHSSYRSFEDQCYTFAIKVRDYTDETMKFALEEKRQALKFNPSGKVSFTVDEKVKLAQQGYELAANMSAAPGRTEHQLGTAVDLTTDENEYKIDFTFENTMAFEWLKQNAHEYGFVLSYPPGPSLSQNDINRYNPKTKYNYEPWHWRYVGIEIATDYINIKNNQQHDLTFQQYLRDYVGQSSSR